MSVLLWVRYIFLLSEDYMNLFWRIVSVYHFPAIPANANASSMSSDFIPIAIAILKQNLSIESRAVLGYLCHFLSRVTRAKEQTKMGTTVSLIWRDWIINQVILFNGITKGLLFSFFFFFFFCFLSSFFLYICLLSFVHFFLHFFPISLEF